MNIFLPEILKNCKGRKLDVSGEVFSAIFSDEMRTVAPFKVISEGESAMNILRSD